jgi:hypothetical protein
VSRVIEPGMDAAQIMALGLEMVAECILHLDCPGDEPLTFPIMLTCCEGSEVLRTISTTTCVASAALEIATSLRN